MMRRVSPFLIPAGAEVGVSRRAVGSPDTYRAETDTKSEFWLGIEQVLTFIEAIDLHGGIYPRHPAGELIESGRSLDASVSAEPSAHHQHPDGPFPPPGAHPTYMS